MNENGKEQSANVELITLSILMTLAPKSANSMPQNGAGARPTNSRTLRPFRAIFWFGFSLFIIFVLFVQ
jgi:hypothetical protein